MEPRGHTTTRPQAWSGAIGSRSAAAAIEPPEARRRRSKRAHVRSVLVVGGAGYIGSLLVRGLLADGYRVRALDSLEFGDGAIRALYTNPDFRLVRGDLRRPEPVVRAVQGVDAVVLLGGVAGEAACRRDKQRALETNIAGTDLICAVARACTVSRLLYASSCAVYGGRTRDVDEASAAHPDSLYAATTLDAERIVLEACNDALHTAVFRLAETFGASLRNRFDFGLNRMAAQALRSGRIPAPRGRGKRPLIHIKDACRVFRHALVAPVEAISGEILNVGTARLDGAWRQGAEALAKADPTLATDALESDVKQNGPRVSFHKLRAKLGFRCTASLAQGVRELLSALEQGRAGAGIRPRPGPAGEWNLPSGRFTAMGFSPESVFWSSIAAPSEGVG